VCIDVGGASFVAAIKTKHRNSSNWVWNCTGLAPQTGTVSTHARTHQLIAHAYTLTSTKPIYKTTITTPSPVRGFSTWLLENKLIHQQRLSTPRDRHYQSHAFSVIRKLFPRIALENLNAKINTIYDDIFNRTIPKASPLYLFYYVVNLGGGVA